MIGDTFSDSVLKTLNYIYQKFELINIVGSIYVFSYNKAKCNTAIPNEGGDVSIAFPEMDIVFVDKACAITFTKEYLESTNSWRDVFEDKDVLLGYSVGCDIVNAYVKSRLEQNRIP